MLVTGIHSNYDNDIYPILILVSLYVGFVILRVYVCTSLKPTEEYYIPSAENPIREQKAGITIYMSVGPHP